jgi:replicative DNA helicase
MAINQFSHGFSPSCQDFISRLEGVRKSSGGYTAKCPAHDDKKNSLKISCGDDGRILVKCFAGCDTAAVVAAVGLTLADMMPPKDNRPRNHETSYKLAIAPGDVVEHIRIDEPGGKRFIWKRNGQMGLGGLKVRDLPIYRPQQHGNEDRVVICEGEKAAIAAGRLGLDAWGTVTGASSYPSVDVLRPICSGKQVILWSDNDDPGKEHMGRIREALKGIAQNVAIIWTGGEKDDAADYRGTKADLEKIIDNSSGKKACRISKKIRGAIDGLAEYTSGNTSNRIPTGIKKIDQSLRGGFMPGAVYLIGAPSGHGKTTLLQILGFHCARHRGPVLFVSPEMSGEELAEREILRESGVSVNQRAPWLPPEVRKQAEVAHANAAFKIQNEDLPVYIMEQVDITMADIAEIAESIPGLRLIILDYAQEIADRTLNVARYLAVGEVGKASIALGKNLNVAVIIASQVNVGKTDKGALDYAFRETKDLENRAHASMIMEVKRKESVNQNGFRDVESTRIFARKNRSGPLFDVQIKYRPEIYSITDHEDKPWAPRPIDDGY